jgi:KUP system potassium uptake protein
MVQRLDSQKLCLGGVLVALGIIFGDIGTSPLYVLKAVIGDTTVSDATVLGALSCIFWTLTLQTTLKYVLLTLRADNRGEGGIFALYALVRRNGRILVLPAIIGGGALLADGIITPPISVSSAVEGLRLLHPDIDTVPIVISILIGLFSVQHFGTRVVGKSFGPIMIAWFGMLFTLGVRYIISDPTILRAISPSYAVQLLWNEPGGFWLLGAIFLCTTGAEALYSDLGHCGRRNIQVSWIFVKISLITNYFGQGAWLMQHQGELLAGKNPFYEVMPVWFLFTGVIIATVATVIASQALISGSFTLVAEAMRLSLLPKARIVYPTEVKGQIYVPGVNALLCLGCIGVTLYFRESSNMEAAYGLAITVTMLATTVLLGAYLRRGHVPIPLVVGFMGLYGALELSFLAANLSKFSHGGWLTVLLAGGLAFMMFVWHKGSRLKIAYTDYENLALHLPSLEALSRDFGVPKHATHLAYMTGAPFPKLIESKVIYSLFHLHPKRADVYWFIHVNVLDTPYTTEYEVTTLIPRRVLRIDFNLGFRVEPRVNLFFRRVLHELSEKGEVDPLSRYESLRNHEIVGDVRFVVLQKELSYESDLPAFERFIMGGYFMMKRAGLSEERSFGLDTSAVTKELVPLVLSPARNFDLQRIDDDVAEVDLREVTWQ